MYRYLRRKTKLYNNRTDRSQVIPWNFSKFIISTQLDYNEFLNPRVEMPQIRATIEGLLNR